MPTVAWWTRYDPTAGAEPVAHSITSAEHTFPGGSTNFLREDGTWAVAGGSTPVATTTIQGKAKVDHDSAGDPIALTQAGHESAADPHSAYALDSEKGAASGIATLDAGGKHTSGQVPFGSTSTTVCVGNDARLSDARTPTQHSITGSEHSFPGGTSTFLRADGTFAAPPGGTEAFPVGAVFLAVVSTNPATLLGYGTWSAFGAGRMLVGLNSGDTDFDTVEETGGAKTHTLTAAEMPVHTHVQDAHNHTQDAHTHTQNAHSHVLTELRDATTGGSTTNIALTADTSSTTGTKTTGSTTAGNQNATATNQAATATNQNAGSGSAHNNLPPYIVVYMWKRTV